MQLPEIEELLLELKQHTKQGNAIRHKKQQLLEYLQINGFTSLSSASGTVTVTKKKGRSRQESEQVLALREAIATEQQEMADANAKAIYEIEREIGLLESRKRSLLRSTWSDELEAELLRAQLEQKADTEQGMALQIEFAEDTASLGEHSEFMASALAEYDQILAACGKGLGRKRIERFIREYSDGRHGNISIYEAWELCKAEHIAYWVRQKSSAS